MWNGNLNDHSQTTAGLYAAFTGGEADIKGFASGIHGLHVGSIGLATYTIGGYITHIDDSGWYIDSVLQASLLSGQISPADGASADLGGGMVTASIEAGLPISLGESWLLEPQAQLIYQHLSLDDVAIENADVAYDLDSSVTLRIGARLEGDFKTDDGRTMQPYALANIWHRVEGSDIADFSTGTGSTAIGTGFGGTSLELGAGTKIELAEDLALYAQGSYLASLFGDNTRQAFKANVGLTGKF